MDRNPCLNNSLPLRVPLWCLCTGTNAHNVDVSTPPTFPLTLLCRQLFFSLSLSFSLFVFYSTCSFRAIRYCSIVYGPLWLWKSWWGIEWPNSYYGLHIRLGAVPLSPCSCCLSRCAVFYITFTPPCTALQNRLSLSSLFNNWISKKFTN